MSAFDDAELPPTDVLPAAETNASSVDLSAPADSNIVSGMTEVASAPSLLMMSASDELLLTEAMTDLSLTSHVDDSQLLPGTGSKSHLDNHYYFYQGAFILLYRFLYHCCRVISHWFNEIEESVTLLW